MTRKDLIPIIAASALAGFIALILSTIFFNPPKRDTKVPAVESFTTTLPDIKTDPSYNSFLNENALDPTRPVQISPSENNVPFNSSR